MHVLLYEWVTGGGLAEQGNLPSSLLVEGAAMVAAVAADFVDLQPDRVTVLRDTRWMHDPLPGCQLVEIDSRAALQHALEDLAAAADHVLVIAPEFDEILLAAVRTVEGQRRPSLNASPEFVRMASCKHRTAQCLQAAEVPVPRAQRLEADELRLPVHFPYPAVLKPLDGAGSQHTLLVDGPGDEPDAYPWPRRLEQFCAGRPASVAVLCGSGGHTPLPPCWQHLSQDGRFTYLGGELIVEADLRDRATRLALRALAAMPAARGYVGVDLILGTAPDGREDRVLEINPRLTTSYVGLRAAVEQNLAAAMLSATAGATPEITVKAPSVRFTAGGIVTAR
jgi:predicted ATP-grasp superfamily ATP-dependent carboligase